MAYRRTVATLVFASLTCSADAAETFQKLGGAQIRAKVAGMELFDGVHSRDAFEHNGIFISHAMGRKVTGKWRVQRDELCLTPAKAEETCYAVWASGPKLELRLKGSELPTLEGELSRSRPVR